MRKNFRAVWLCFLCAAISIGASPVSALELSPTPTDEFPTAPLMITAYQTAAAATILVAVEVYNPTTAPVSLTDWHLSVTTKDSAVHDIASMTTHQGWLLPGEHVVYAPDDHATYRLTVTKQLSQIMTIQLSYSGNDAAYRAATATVKDTLDLPMFRAYTTTGYSTAAQPFAATPARSFYDDGLYAAPVQPDGLKIVEIYPYASDCAPNDTSVLCGDYVKLQNTTDHALTLDDLMLRTDSSSSSRTSSNTITLAGTLEPQAVQTIARTDGGSRLSLTNSGGYVWLEDTWNFAHYDTTMTHYISAGTSQQGYAYALADNDTWQWTTTPQPTASNLITAPAVIVSECPDGKYRSPETGRCRTLEETVNALATCEEGYERNPTTNRCRKTVTAMTVATLTPCLEGQERNPTTNRCRSIASAVAELMPCDEGYDRNPETNRCRKVQVAAMPVAAFPVQPTEQPAKDPSGTIALASVAALALGYAVWEWRREIGRGLRSMTRFLAHSK